MANTKSGDACHETMQPFDPKDGLVLIERHIEVDQFEFGGLLILGEFRLPGLLIEWRHRAADRIPLCDRKPGACETTNPP